MALTTDTARAEDDQALATRLRPYLYFDTGERWRPIDVDGFLAESGHSICTPTPAACTPLTSLAQVTSAITMLNLRGTARDGKDATAPDLATCSRSVPGLRDCDGPGRSVIYAHVVHTPALTAIDYWWFLRFNAFSGDQHEGDWEKGSTVVTDPSATTIREVHFAARASTWRYGSNVTSFAGQHVRVLVARGSHASYPRTRAHPLCRQTGSLIVEGRYDGRRPWRYNADAACQCVKLLPAGARLGNRPRGTPGPADGAAATTASRARSRRCSRASRTPSPRRCRIASTSDWTIRMRSLIATALAAVVATLAVLLAPPAPAAAQRSLVGPTGRLVLERRRGTALRGRHSDQRQQLRSLDTRLAGDCREELPDTGPVIRLQRRDGRRRP